MSDIAIRVENLGKRYRIGAKQERYQRFTETAMDALTAPIRRVRQALQRSSAHMSTRSNDIIWALRDVSFEVQRGEVVGIIGRNGAGKSTLLKILSRITEPTTGRVELRGRVGSLLEVGTGFHPELTGRENVYLNGAILGMRREEIGKKFDEIVEFSGVEQFLDTPVKRYSSGMQVRLAFAVAAHLEPEILLIDEVLAVGDAAFQQKCLGKMSEVAGQGRTVLFVSHNMGAVASLCPRAILIADGKIAVTGPSADVITAYLHEATSREHDGHVDLRNWSGDRKGDGPMRVTFLETRQADGRLGSRFAYGEPVRFRFGVDPVVNDASCIVGISIRDALGRLLLHLTNTDDDAPLDLRDGGSVITALLPSNLLNDGVYHVSVWLGDGLNILHDRVGDCLSFRVESSTEGSIRSRAPIRLRAQWGVEQKGSA